jgi:hypothetical protein
MTMLKSALTRVLPVLALAAGALAVPVGTASAATCNQPSHAWIDTNYGDLPPGNFSIPGYATMTFAAVAEPGKDVTYEYYTPNGNPLTGAGLIKDNSVGPAHSNCVVNQVTVQASFIPYVGQIKVYVQYYAWETNNLTLDFLGYFTKTS